MRLLHTSDWQLGLARYYLDADARARHAADRLEAVRRLGEIARAEGAAALVVAGDVFDSNRVDGTTLRRGLDAMGSVGVPVLLLPGNHDPLDAGSVYRSQVFRAARPENVRVLDGDEPVEVAPGLEVVGAAWPSRRPGADLVAALAARLDPAPAGRVRVAVAHGAIAETSPDRDDPAAISLEAAERAIGEGRFHYLALGDRHSATRVAERVWYSGTPEATDFVEERPGRALLVDLAEGGCRVEERQVGRWRFLQQAFRLAGDGDVERLAAWLEEVEEKPRAAVRLTLEGGLSLHARARLDGLLEAARERFASVEAGAGEGGWVVLPDEVDREALGLAGWAERAFEALLAETEGRAAGGAGAIAGDEASRSPAGAPGRATEDPGAPAPDPAIARDALALLYRLAGPAG